MKDKNLRNTLVAAALAAIGVSVCCVAPLVLVLLGVGGAWVATLTQLSPLEPVLSVLTIVLLAFAGYRLYRSPSVCAPGEECVPEPEQRRQRTIFWIVAAALIGLVSFPFYSSVFL